MARICSVCHKKADTITQTANTVGKAVICWDCYNKIRDFSLKSSFESLEDIENNEEIVMTELQENRFPPEVIHEYQKYYEEKKYPFQREERMITTTSSFDGYWIREYLGLVSGEAEINKTLFSSLEKPGHAFGINEAQDRAASAAMREARRKGANAIVGARTDVVTDLACVLVTGTAVIVEEEN